MRSSSVYLGLYNALQACGWISLLLTLVKQPNWSINPEESRLAVFLQASAFLEVLHSAFGLVRSGTLTAFMQWAGRTHVIVAVASQIGRQQLQSSSWFFSMLIAWSLSEVIRYPHYLFSTLGMCPRWLTWLRYTAFVVLYPIGVASEMALISRALPHVKKRSVYSSLFQHAPFTYYDFLNALLLVYPMLALVLYRHMLNQRAAKLRRKTRAA